MRQLRKTILSRDGFKHFLIHFINLELQNKLQFVFLISFYSHKIKIILNSYKLIKKIKSEYFQHKTYICM